MVQGEDLQGPGLQVAVGPGLLAVRASGTYDGDLPTAFYPRVR